MTSPPLRIVDSITELRPHDAGCVAISGSHGGISSAQYAELRDSIDRPLFNRALR